LDKKRYVTHGAVAGNQEGHYAYLPQYTASRMHVGQRHSYAKLATRMSVGLLCLVGETICLLVQGHRGAARRPCVAAGWG